MTTSESTTTTAHDSQQSSAITFFGKMLTFSRLKFTSNDLAVIDNELSKLLGKKDSQIPVIIDSDIEQNLEKLVDLLWSWGLQPIGVVQGVLEEQAQAQRLAIFPADGKRIERIRPSQSVHKSPQTTKNDTPESVSSSPTSVSDNVIQEELSDVVDEGISSLIYDQILRSGQSINHVGGDLILTNSVNDGAEAITDNTLHIYGRGLGRLVAGATGDKDARIFCQRFNPSLVSVAGTYCLRDNIPSEVIDKPVQVSYQEGKGLVFTIMG